MMDDPERGSIRTLSGGFAIRATAGIIVALVLATTGRAACAHQSDAGGAAAKTAALVRQLHEPGNLIHHHDAAAALLAMKPVPPEALIEVLRSAGMPDAYVLDAVTEAAPLPLPDLSVAAHNGDAHVRAGAVFALGDMAKHDPQAWPILLAELADGDAIVRIDAVAQFAKAPPSDAATLVPKLRALLRDKSPDTRMAALQAIQNLGPKAKDATPDIALMLADSEQDIRWQAAGALGAIGPSARDALGNLHAGLNASDHGLRQQAAFAIARIDPNDRAAVPALIEGLGPDSVDVGAALQSIAAMGPDAQASLPALAHLLTVGRRPSGASDEITSDDAVRKEVAKMIGKVGGANAVSALSNALTHDNFVEVRAAAVASLEALGDESAPAIPVLVETLHDEDRDIRDTAADTLGKLGKLATPALIAALKSKDLYTREGAVAALAKIHPLPDDAVHALADVAAHDKSEDVRDDADLALRSAQGPSVNAAIAQLPTLPAAPEATATPGDENKRWRKNEIVATIPTDDDHEYPLTLANELAADDGRFLVTLHQGKDRGDRLAIWKKVGADQYQRLQLIEANVDVDETISPPSLFTPKGQPENQKTQFLDIVSGTRCCSDETVFAIDRDAHELRPVQIESPEKRYASMLAPGEHWTPYNVNTFADNQELSFSLIIAKKTDAGCCPSAGQIVGTYAIVKAAASDGSSAPICKFVRTTATRQPMPPP